MPSVRLASYYLIFQGAAGVLWWLLLLIDSPVRDWFFSTDVGWQAGRLLLVADVVMFGCASIIAGALALRNHQRSSIAGWITVGATAYATVAAFGWIAEPVGHWLGAVLMTPTLVATCISAWILETTKTQPMVR